MLTLLAVLTMGMVMTLGGDGARGCAAGTRQEERRPDSAEKVTGHDTNIRACAD